MERGREVFDVSSGQRTDDNEIWWWNEKVQEKEQRRKWDCKKMEESRQEYKEMHVKVKREVAKAKQKAYDEAYH